MSPVTTGALVGLVGGLGLWLVLVRLPVMRRPYLDARLAPYLRDAARPSTLLARPTRAQLGGGVGLGPAVSAAASVVDRVLGGGPSVARRLRRAGLGDDVAAFRAQQVLWGAAGLGAGMLLGSLLWVLGDGSAVAPVVVALCAGAGGVVARDQWLSRQVRAREERILTEFPTVAEVLALAVGAGEGAVAALERVCRLAGGDLSDELRTTLAAARAGETLTEALQGLADRTGLPSLARFVGGVVIAVERGTPLADVLRAQAQDAREEGRRALLEAGGKKEIAMMVPVVFLVLPVTVAFAVFPGLAFLSFDV